MMQNSKGYWALLQRQAQDLKHTLLFLKTYIMGHLAVSVFKTLLRAAADAERYHDASADSSQQAQKRHWKVWMQLTYRSIKCSNICSLPAICIWYSYVNDVPCFFSPPSCVCACVFVCVVCFSLVYFFPCTSSPPPILFVSPNKKMQKIWIHTSSFRGGKIRMQPAYFCPFLLGD